MHFLYAEARSIVKLKTYTMRPYENRLRDNRMEFCDNKRDSHWTNGFQLRGTSSGLKGAERKLYIQVQKQVSTAMVIFHLNGISGFEHGSDGKLALRLDCMSSAAKTSGDVESEDAVRAICVLAMARAERRTTSRSPMLLSRS